MLHTLAACKWRCLSLRGTQRITKLLHELADLELQLFLPLHHLVRLLLEPLSSRAFPLRQVFELALGRHYDLRSRRDLAFDPLRGDGDLRTLSRGRYPRPSIAGGESPLPSASLSRVNGRSVADAIIVRDRGDRRAL